MGTPATPKVRRDAARNRVAILTAARALFEAGGAHVAFEDVAKAAGLSRTSLTRHFPDRADLVAALWESDVTRIEELARSVAGEPTGLVVVLDHVLGGQVDRMALHPSQHRIDGPQLAPLVARVRTVFEVLLARARAAGVAHDDVDVEDVLAVVDMCAAGITHAQSREDRQAAWHRVRRITYRGLFTVHV